MTKYSDIKVSNCVASQKWEGHHVLVSTLGTINNLYSGRSSIDLSALKCIVVDEADDFFGDLQNFKPLKTLNDRVFSKLKNKV